MITRNVLEMFLTDDYNPAVCDGVIFKKEHNEHRDNLFYLEKIVYDAIYYACFHRYESGKSFWLEEYGDKDNPSLEIYPHSIKIILTVRGEHNNADLLAAVFNICKHYNIGLEIIPVNKWNLGNAVFPVDTVGY